MGQTLNPNVLLGIVLAPLAGAILAGFFGKIIGRKGSHRAAILGVAIACALSLWVFFQVAHGAHFDGAIYTWAAIGSLKLEVGFLVDSLTVTMLVVVSFVSLMVHIYTIGYMDDDPGYERFFAYISLFTFSMLMLVMANNMLQLFFGWEAVGLVSYLLIGFWYTRESAIYANLKAFLVNRVGDFGFILGIGLLWAFSGTLHYSEIFAHAPELAKLTLPGTGWGLVTVTSICLFIGAMGKSAQFPLHVWLPDSMEGPTPISALIHAATMVTAGIFMVARMSPLFELSDAALSFVVIIGSITALFMGLLGIVQNDIKRVIAYSTLSQLGYMTIALGVSAYPVAIFHLMTHAFFKALLFLAAGSVILGMHHDQDIRHMGGLRKYMPITWITFLIGTLALCGTPFFSGFYSKDSIIEAAAASHLWGAGFGYFAAVAGVFVTGFYSFRVYFLVFHGKERFAIEAHVAPHTLAQSESDAHALDALGAAAHSEHHDVGIPHESPWVVTLPLAILAFFSVVAGYVIDPMLFRGFFDGAIAVADKHPAMAHLKEDFHGTLAMALGAFGALPVWLAIAAAVFAWYCYIRNPAFATMLKERFRPVYVLLDNKYYLDRLNEIVIARGTRVLGGKLWRRGDIKIIDGIVNGSANTVGWFASVIRQFQTGILSHYAMVMIVGVLGFMSWFVVRQIIPH